MSEDTRRPLGPGRATLVYSVLRLLLFAALFGLMVLAGFGGLTSLLLAAAVSAVLSYFLLARQRTAMGEGVERRIERAKARAAARTAREDAADELLRAQHDERPV